MDEAQIRLVDQSRSSEALVSTLFGVAFAGIGTALLVTQRSDLGGFASVIMLAFVAAGLLALFNGVRKFWLRYLLGTPTLLVPSTDILLGDTVSTRFERSGGSRRGRAGRRELSAGLVCRETVTYRRGTNTETVTHEARRIPLPATMDDHPRAVAGRVQVVVPVDWPPTIALDHNKVQTVVEVLVTAPGLPEDRSSFIVPVRSAVRSTRPGVSERGRS